MRTEIFPVMFLAMLLAVAVACSSSEAAKEPVVFLAEGAEEGSDETAILEVFDNALTAFIADDWEGYQEDCNPTWPRLTAAQAEQHIDQLFARADMSGWELKNVRVTTYNDGTAIATSDGYVTGELAYEGLRHS